VGITNALPPRVAEAQPTALPIVELAALLVLMLMEQTALCAHQEAAAPSRKPPRALHALPTHSTLVETMLASLAPPTISAQLDLANA
jgi:hypothetical protein